MNCSPDSVQVSDTPRVARVVPRLKKEGLDNIHGNYWPVNSVPFLSKVLEKVVFSQLTNCLQQHQLLDPLQSASKSKDTRTTQDQKADIYAILDEKGSVLLVMLDPSAAFDTLNHSTAK